MAVEHINTAMLTVAVDQSWLEILYVLLLSASQVQYVVRCRLLAFSQRSVMQVSTA